MHRDADRAGLIGDRAGDRLPDPPGRIGREFIAAPIFELIDRLHQADIAFLDQIEELQAAIGVFLGDRNDEPQVRLDHFLLGLTRLALAFLNHMDDLAEFLDFETRLGREPVNFREQILDLLLGVGDEILPAAPAELRDPQKPFRIELGILVILEKILAA